MGQKIFREQELKEVLSEIQKERDVHQVLLVCGESFRRQKLYETLYSTLKELGIILTEGGLMMPSKSVTAVIGISPVKGFCRTEGCEACEKKDCPYRRSLGQGRET